MMMSVKYNVCKNGHGLLKHKTADTHENPVPHYRCACTTEKFQVIYQYFGRVTLQFSNAVTTYAV